MSRYEANRQEAELQRFCNQTKRGNHMSFKNIGICAAALVFATMIVSLAQAAGSGGNKGGVSAIAPGRLPPVKGEPGHSGNAPGDLKPAGSNAKELAPGDQNSDQNSKSKKK